MERIVRQRLKVLSASSAWAVWAGGLADESGFRVWEVRLLKGFFRFGGLLAMLGSKKMEGNS